MSFKTGVDPADYLTRPDAVELLEEYRRDFTGFHFEQYASSGIPGCFTTSDIVAVNMLSVDIPARASIALLQDQIPGHEGRIGKCLDAIPEDATIWDHENHLGPDTPAQRLWAALSELDGLGRTKKSKLLAAKRPHLFPIFDSVVGTALFENPRTDYIWEPWRVRLTAPDSDHVRSLCENLRRRARYPDGFPTLRVFDVVIWMSERPQAR